MIGTRYVRIVPTAGRALVSLYFLFKSIFFSFRESVGMEYFEKLMTKICPLKMCLKTF